MANHPARPTWGPLPSPGSTGGGSTHPDRPYGTPGAGVTPGPYAGHSRTGRQTPIGPMPTRAPEMSPDESEITGSGFAADNTAG